MFCRHAAEAALLLSLASLCGCSTSTPSTPSSPSESTDDTGTTSKDGGTKSGSTKKDAGEKDSGIETSDASAGAVCSFNRECISSERCECVDGDCQCKPGKRGTGKSGIDTCTDGNDCESAVCLEGPGDVTYCSGECGSGSDCTGVLPICSEIAFVGKICIRSAK